MESKQTLIAHLIRTDVLRTERIIHAFNAIDRKDFVTDEHKDDPYGDFPLSIGYGQTLSQPTTVAMMLELLQPQGGDMVLDVGSGSGWTTALLAHIVGTSGGVCGVERVPELVDFGTANIKKYSLTHVCIQKAGNVLGLPEKGPFDRILVSAASDSLLDDLVGQLKSEGTMVIPIGTALWKIVKSKSGKVKKEIIEGFVFVPLIRLNE